MNTEAEEARPLGTGSTQAGKRVISKDSLSEHKSIAHPPLCMKCSGRVVITALDGPVYCGLMAESMKAGTPVTNCIYFRGQGE